MINDNLYETFDNIRLEATRSQLIKYISKHPKNSELKDRLYSVMRIQIRRMVEKKVE